VIPWKGGPPPPAHYHFNSSFARGILGKKYLACAIGRHVFVVGPSLEVGARLEEEKHVEQWYRFGRFGLGFLVRYAWYQYWFGYEHNPLEREARVAGLVSELRLHV
jgi:hypothetical protein